MHYRKLAFTSAVAAAMALTAGAASASHSWNGYHWARTSNPFTLKVVDSVTPTWDSTFQDALSHWGQSTILDFNVAASDDSGKTRRRCPMVTGQMRVCNNTYGRNGWLGLATIGLDNQGHIDQGTAQMNDSYSEYWTQEEMNHVMCQETGHVFGLAHTSEDGSSQNTCMDYSTSSTSQWPNQHDYDELQTIYSHTDSYNSYDDSTGGGGGGGGGGGKPCNAPPGKGCNKFGARSPTPLGLLVHATDRYQIWVANRPDGGLWVSHVLLAPANGNAH